MPVCLHRHEFDVDLSKVDVSKGGRSFKMQCPECGMWTNLTNAAVKELSGIKGDDVIRALKKEVDRMNSEGESFDILKVFAKFKEMEGGGGLSTAPDVIHPGDPGLVFEPASPAFFEAEPDTPFPGADDVEPEPMVEKATVKKGPTLQVKQPRHEEVRVLDDSDDEQSGGFQGFVPRTPVPYSELAKRCITESGLPAHVKNLTIKLLQFEPEGVTGAQLKTLLKEQQVSEAMAAQVSSRYDLEVKAERLEQEQENRLISFLGQPSDSLPQPWIGYTPAPGMPPAPMQPPAFGRTPGYPPQPGYPPVQSQGYGPQAQTFGYGQPQDRQQYLMMLVSPIAATHPQLFQSIMMTPQLQEAIIANPMVLQAMVGAQPPQQQPGAPGQRPPNGSNGVTREELMQLMQQQQQQIRTMVAQQQPQNQQPSANDMLMVKLMEHALQPQPQKEDGMGQIASALILNMIEQSRSDNGTGAVLEELKELRKNWVAPSSNVHSIEAMSHAIEMQRLANEAAARRDELDYKRESKARTLEVVEGAASVFGEALASTLMSPKSEAPVMSTQSSVTAPVAKPIPVGAKGPESSGEGFSVYECPECHNDVHTPNGVTDVLCPHCNAALEVSPGEPDHNHTGEMGGHPLPERPMSPAEKILSGMPASEVAGGGSVTRTASGVPVVNPFRSMDEESDEFPEY